MYVFCIRTHFGPCEAGSLSQQAKKQDKNEAFFLAHTTTTSVVTMADPVVTNDALAAAVAAAAEIAKNGGGFLFNTPSVAAVHTETPSALSLMFPATARQFLEQTPHLLQSQQRNVDESCTHASDEDDDREIDEEDAEGLALFDGERQTRQDDRRKCCSPATVRATVCGSGFFFFPFAGCVDCQRQTVSQARADGQKRLSGVQVEKKGKELEIC